MNAWKTSRRYYKRRSLKSNSVSGKDFKEHTGSERRITMNKGRKTTKEERIEIVAFCIENSKNHRLTMEKYGVSYQQIYSWMRKYEWMRIWYDTYCEGSLKPSSLINYETYIEKHIKPTIGNVKLCELTPLRLQSFYQEKFKNGRLDGKGGLSPKTMRNIHAMIHTGLDRAYKLGYIPHNIADLVSPPRSVKIERLYFTVEEQKELQKHLDGERIGMAVLLDLYTGLRKGELLGLPWKNVHIDLNGESYLRIIKHLPVWTSAQSFMFPC